MTQKCEIFIRKMNHKLALDLARNTLSSTSLVDDKAEKPNQPVVVVV